jgi:hypothetical protein
VGELAVPAELAAEGGAIRRKGVGVGPGGVAHGLVFGFGGQATGLAVAGAAPGAVGGGFVGIDLDRPVPGHRWFRTGCAGGSGAGRRAFRHQKHGHLLLRKPRQAQPASVHQRFEVAAALDEFEEGAVADELAFDPESLDVDTPFAVFVVPAEAGPVGGFADADLGGGDVEEAGSG